MHNYSKQIEKIEKEVKSAKHWSIITIVSASISVVCNAINLILKYIN